MVAGGVTAAPESAMTDRVARPRPGAAGAGITHLRVQPSAWPLARPLLDLSRFTSNGTFGTVAHRSEHYSEDLFGTSKNRAMGSRGNSLSQEFGRSLEVTTGVEEEDTRSR